jgi:hypothetical protein
VYDHITKQLCDEAVTAIITQIVEKDLDQFCEGVIREEF